MLEWIKSRRARGLRVSCKLIMKKAEITYGDMTENNLMSEAKWVVIATKDLHYSARSRENGGKTCIICNAC